MCVRTYGCMCARVPSAAVAGKSIAAVAERSRPPPPHTVTFWNECWLDEEKETEREKLGNAGSLPTSTFSLLLVASSASSYPAPLFCPPQASTLQHLYPHLRRTSTRLHTSKLHGSLESAPPSSSSLLPVPPSQTTMAFSVISSCSPHFFLSCFLELWLRRCIYIYAVKARAVRDAC